MSNNTPAEFTTLELPEQRGVAVLRFSRPPANLITLQLAREIALAARRVGKNERVAALVVYGDERIFSAGDDLAEIATWSPDQATALASDHARHLDCLSPLPCPTVAAITGYCLGGALELALGADRRIVGDNVKLGLPQIHRGTVPTAGMDRLIRTVGLRTARDLVYSGRYVEAEEALRLGLVDEVVAPDDVYDAAHRWAARFVGLPGAAVAAAKSVLEAPAQHSAHAISAWIGLAQTGEPQRAAGAYAADGPNQVPGTGR
ncbi:enoyl-CoA hydratase-related protein [Nocardia asteroides]|uniref:enoyl-CoA hydratase-related protein n=1 Tax=Nocardia asteroides TaxID=1824 RepID=UPI001E2F343F|nr:enoyl-CoA hydratase-related protein [Nocardia asteroides]UGT63850.1 enoyl-CoA hydratase-related protein [Nocardia asteroides]